MTRETAWKRWRRGTPMQELATLMGVSIGEIEEIIRKKLISRDAKLRRGPTVRGKAKQSKSGAAK
jgi:hypothetical protein